MICPSSARNVPVEQLGWWVLEDIPGFFQRPITPIVVFLFPGVIRPAIHELGHKNLTHVFEGVFLAQEVAARAYVSIASRASVSSSTTIPCITFWMMENISQSINICA